MPIYCAPHSVLHKSSYYWQDSVLSDNVFFKTKTIFSVQKDNTLSYHCSCCGLSCDGCLTGLLLARFDFGLQVCRRVKVLALFPGAAALDVVHANSDSVICGVNHWIVTGVSKAAICLPSCTVSPLKLTTDLSGAI